VVEEGTEFVWRAGRVYRYGNECLCVEEVKNKVIPVN